MLDEAGSTEPRRGLTTRIGICLLNFWQPGLGLIRLGRNRAGLAAIGAATVLLAGIPAFYSMGPQVTYQRYVALLVVVLVLLVLIYGTALLLSWRWSREILPRHGWLYRWYGVVGLGIAATVVWQLLPSARSHYKPYYAASKSMAPTLQENDRLLAQMQNLPTPRRGDVIIVRVGDDDYVTRLAALPGDRIAMRGGRVVLNGKPVAQQALGAGTPEQGSSQRLVRHLAEQFPGEARRHIVLDSGVTPQDEMPEVVLGQGEYFVLGDNRDNSVDSRFGAPPFAPGIVTRDRILGRALFRFWRNNEGLKEGRL